MRRAKPVLTKTLKTNSKNDENALVFLMKDDIFQKSEENGQQRELSSIVKLRHPCTDQPSLFLFSTDDTVQEIFTFFNKKSWFIDESVIGNGKVHIGTHVDPIFLVLPYLMKRCGKQAVPLDHILIDDDYPEIEKLLRAKGLKYLESVTDQKGDEELKAFKYNEGKTLIWLEKKVKRVADVLKEKNIHVASGSTSSTFVKSLNDEQPPSAYLKCAHGIVSDYLTEDLSDKLLKHLNLPEDERTNVQSNKRKNPTDTESSNKKIKSNVKEPESEIPKLESKTKKTAASFKEKARAKAATGSKNISSFFKKI